MTYTDSYYDFPKQFHIQNLKLKCILPKQSQTQNLKLALIPIPLA